MPLKPFVDHGASQQFGLCPITVYHFSGAFNVLGMNGYDPLVPFYPGADRISYSPVFHWDIIALSLELGNRIGGASDPGLGLLTGDFFLRPDEECL
jgi:hypothetical protein